MTHVYSGQCPCKSTTVEVQLPRALQTYSPRSCTCEFCQAHDGTYLSDPEGSMVIHSVRSLKTRYQGDEIAQMIHCADCDALISAAIENDVGLLGNVRVSLLANISELEPVTMIAPQTLSADEKRVRWGSLWMKLTIANTASGSTAVTHQ